MASSSRSVPDTSYHHFVPQFILRNSVHPYEPAGKDRNKGGKKRKDKNELYPGMNVANAINITGATVEIIRAKVARTFGV